jgi:hypothetical protein
MLGRETGLVARVESYAGIFAIPPPNPALDPVTTVRRPAEDKFMERVPDFQTVKRQFL